jgi:alcohol dehydrogenase class IV
MAQARFYVPTEIVMGAGCFDRLGGLVARLGARAVLVGSPGRRPLLERAARLLSREGVESSIFAEVRGEPALELVEQARGRAQSSAAQVIVGIGGGSALDAAKAAAGLFRQPGAVAEYHGGRKLDPVRGLPLVAVPTTAGTGAEVTRNAVLIDPVRGVKASIRDDSWFPALAVVDPELTLSLPSQLTASTGADALCQAIESYVSTGAGALTDALAAEAILRIGRSYRRAVLQGDDLEARGDMLCGSLMAGMAMASAGLGAVHGLAHPLGARYGAAHGVICGLLLPYVMAYNLDFAPQKYAQVAGLLGVDAGGGTAAEAGRMAAGHVRRMLAEAGVPMHLASLGVREEDLEAVTAEAMGQSSLRYNPCPMQPEDVRAVLEAAL